MRQTESGMELFGVSPRILKSREQEPVGEQNALTPLPPSHRVAITEHSRAAHTRPRAEVERMVLEQLGLSAREVFEDSPEGRVRERLSHLGMGREVANALLSEFGMDAVERQLKWLPYRHAKNPARYVAAAVRGRYGEPMEYRRGVGAAPPERTDAAVSLSVPDGT